MANVEALRNVLEFITAHPEKHDQHSWWRSTSCGTSGCLAGWAVSQSLEWEFATDSTFPEHYSLARSDNSVLTVGHAAEEILGLTAPEADTLFDSENTLPELWAISSAITEGAIEVPEDIRNDFASEHSGFGIFTDDIDQFISEISEYIRQAEEDGGYTFDQIADFIERQL